MKTNWNKKYTTISIYITIVILISISFYIALSNFGFVLDKINKLIDILNPIIIGLFIAYLLNFILNMYERKIEGKSISKYKRHISVTLTYVSVIILLLLFFKFILPQLIESIYGLINNVPKYALNVSKKLNELEKNISLPKEFVDLIIKKWENFVKNSIDFLTNLIPIIGNFIKRILSSIWNIILGLIISIYVLFEKERFVKNSKRILKAYLSDSRYDRTLELIRRADEIFGKFLSGKILDSIIISVLTFILLSIFKIPYKLLISFIIGVTNIIPFFGPFIGAIPSFFIILFESPIKAITFLIIIIVVQQIDGNIIGPKILGDSLGVSPFWIMVSLLVSGKLFGFIGLVFGVPLFVFLDSILEDSITIRLKQKNKKHKE